MKLPQGLLASLPLSTLSRTGFTKVPTSGDVAVLVYFHGDEPRAVWDLCPHMGAPLSDGELTAQGRLRCPWHGYEFDGADGRMVHNPNDRIFGCMKHLYKSFDAAKTPQYRLKHLHCVVLDGILSISAPTLVAGANPEASREA